MIKLKFETLVTMDKVDEIMLWLRTVEHQFPFPHLGEIWFVHSEDALEFILKFGL